MGFKHYSDRIESDVSLRLLNGARLNSRSPQITDHFTYGAGALNSHVPQYWVTTETGAATPYAPSASVVNGALVGVTGATTNNAEEIAGKGVIWNPSTMGPLVMEIRLKHVGATTATDGDIYFGFADAVTYTNGLPYVLSAASAFTTSAPSNFSGFGYTSIATSGAAFLSGGNPYVLVNTIADTDSVTATTVVKDSNYHIFRIELDTGGNAVFYIDDAVVGTKASAMTANTAMTPYLTGIAKNSHAQTITIDYWHVGGSYA